MLSLALSLSRSIAYSLPHALSRSLAPSLPQSSPWPLSLSRRYAGSKVRIQNEQFVELFDTDLVTVDRRPSWL